MTADSMTLKDAGVRDHRTTQAALCAAWHRLADLDAVIAPQEAGRRLSYAGLLDEADTAAALIERGVQPGDRVALWAPNTWEWVVASLGVLFSEAVLVPINTRLRGYEAAHGDIGVLDERGYLDVTSRKTDMFIVGGFNTYLAEVENAMLAHPAVASVAVVGVPDARLGEVGAAFVVARPGESPAQSELLSWCRERLANYKVPRYVWFTDTLPMNAAGKVLKHRLRDHAADLLSPRGAPLMITPLIFYGCTVHASNPG